MEPRKIMVVADPTKESAAALQYALCHAIVEQDELILIHVENPNTNWKSTISTIFRLPSSSNNQPNAPSSSSSSSSASEPQGSCTSFLDQMKHACENAQPKIRVRLERVELEGNMDKADTLLFQSTMQGVDVLVIGQRKSFSGSLLGNMRPGGSGKGAKPVDTADFLIENCKCTCVGVHKRQNAGYVLNTKTHKNFWLLA